MNKIIYIVTSGSYSDYTIVAPFLEKAKAAALVCALSTNSSEYRIDEYRIEEYTVDDNASYMTRILHGYKLYYILMKKNGDSSIYIHTSPTCSQYHNIYSYDPTYKTLSCYIWAKSKEHAVKIANERRTRMIANGKWPNE